MNKVLSQEDMCSNLHFLVISCSQWLISNDYSEKLLTLQIMMIAQTPGTYV